MSKTFFTLALIATLVLLAAAQDSKVLPPVTMRANTQAVSTHPDAQPTMARSSGNLPFCPPKTCLYYAGDFDWTDSNANGLFNSNYDGGQLVGQAWVGVKPDHDVIVTGATFVEFIYDLNPINPTPFAVQVGIKPGQAGKTICSTSGNATVTYYQYNNQFPDYAITVKKLAKSCELKKGKVYYVSLLPTSNAGYGYVANVEDRKPKNHYGWKNDLNDCYWNGTAFGANYVTCNSQGIGTNGFSELSIALTGKETR